MIQKTPSLFKNVTLQELSVFLWTPPHRLTISITDFLNPWTAPPWVLSIYSSFFHQQIWIDSQFRSSQYMSNCQFSRIAYPRWSLRLLICLFFLEAPFVNEEDSLDQNQFLSWWHSLSSLGFSPLLMQLFFCVQIPHSRPGIFIVVNWAIACINSWPLCRDLFLLKILSVSFLLSLLTKMVGPKYFLPTTSLMVEEPETRNLPYNQFFSFSAYLLKAMLPLQSCFCAIPGHRGG